VVLGFASQEDARRVMEVLPKRFAKYGLTIHPEKTRVVMFKKPCKGNPQGRIQSKPGTFNFLGFTHSWRKSRKGNWVIVRSTDRSRFARSLKRLTDWCRRNRHKPVKEQHAQLQRKLEGHCAYYGITGNYSMLANFRYQVVRAWRKWLSRRSNDGWKSWEKFNLLLKRYPLGPMRVVHSVYSAKL